MEEVSFPPRFPISKMEKVKREKDEKAEEDIGFGQSRLEKILMSREKDSG